VLRKNKDFITIDVQVKGAIKPELLKLYNTYSPAVLPIVTIPFEMNGKVRQDVDLRAVMSTLKQGGFHVIVTSTEFPLGELGAKLVFGSHLEGLVDLSATGIRYLFGGLLYVNVHTVENPVTGEVRGQLARPSASLCPVRPTPFVNTCFYSVMTSGQAVPRLVQTTAPQVSGTAGFLLKDLGTLTYSIAVHSFVGQPATLRVVFGVGDVGSDGVIAHEVAVDGTVTVDGTIEYVSSWVATSSPVHLTALSEGKMYVAVFNAGLGTQLIRGQVPALAIGVSTMVRPGEVNPTPPPNGLLPLAIGEFSSTNFVGSGTRQAIVGQQLTFQPGPNQRILTAIGLDPCNGQIEGKQTICDGNVVACTYEITPLDLVNRNITFVDSEPAACRAGAKLIVAVFAEGELGLNAAAAGVAVDNTAEASVVDLAKSVDLDAVKSIASAEYTEVLARDGSDAIAAALEACLCVVQDARSQTTLDSAASLCQSIATEIALKDVIRVAVPNALISSDQISSANLWAFGHQLSNAFSLPNPGTTTAALQPGQVVPRISSGASGSGTVSFDGDGSTISYSFTVTGVMVTAGHFHGPAGRGVAAAASVLHALPPLVAGTVSGTWKNVPDDVVAMFRSGLVYVNMHTAEHPNGGLRGQVEFSTNNAVQDVSLFSDQPMRFSAQISSHNVVPAPIAVVGSRGSGTGTFTVVGQTSVKYDISVAGVVITAGHIHGPAGRGFNTPASVLHTLEFVGGRASGTWEGVAAAEVSYLVKGELYVNVHSATWPQGEVRGQIEATDQTVALTSTVALEAQEAAGLSAPQFNGVASLRRCLVGSCIEYDITLNLPGQTVAPAAHFHGPAFAGFDGDVQHTIELAATGGVGTFTSIGKWTLSAQQMEWVLGDLIYVNVHATPVVRGQVVFTKAGEPTYLAFSCPQGQCAAADLIGASLALGSNQIQVDEATFSVAAGGAFNTKSFIGTAIFLAIVFGLLFALAVVAGDKGDLPGTGGSTNKPKASMAGALYEPGRDAAQTSTTPEYVNPYAKEQSESKKAPARPPPGRPPPSRPKQQPIWEAVIDPASGDTYYINSVTNEVTWEVPGSEA
jgi:hypothetical protein